MLQMVLSMRFCRAGFRSGIADRCATLATSLEGDLRTIDAVFAVDQRS